MAYKKDDRSEGSLGSWFGNLFSGNEETERPVRESKELKKSSVSKKSHTGTMSRSEAGRLGGLAPHRCRGRECDEIAAKRHKGAASRSNSWSRSDSCE